MILRVSYTQPGVMRVGVEAVWRVGDSKKKGERGGDVGKKEQGEVPRVLAGWDRDMPAVSEPF